MVARNVEAAAVHAAQDDVSYTLPAGIGKCDAGPAKRPFTSAVISFGGTLASAACAAGSLIMYDGEGRRRQLFGGPSAPQTVAIPATNRLTTMVQALPQTMAAAVPTAETVIKDLTVDPRRISDMWDSNGSRSVAVRPKECFAVRFPITSCLPLDLLACATGPVIFVLFCRRKLSAYRIEADRLAAEQRDAEAADQAAAEQAVAAAEAAAAPNARDEVATAGTFVALYDEFG